MKLGSLLKAIEILANYHTTELVINKCFSDQVRIDNNIAIKSCCQAAIESLQKAGFGLSMRKGYLVINDRNLKEQL